MKDQSKKEFWVGLFALLTFAAIIYMSLQSNRNSNISGDTQTFYAKFDTVTGLVVKIPVEVSGIIAGYVNKIELEDNKARVTIIVQKGVTVHEDATLLIRDRGVLGDRYVVLLPGSDDSPVLKDGSEITNTESMSDFEKLSKNLAETAEIIKELVQSDNPEGALGQTIVNLRDVTGKIDQMVADNQLAISSILGNVDSLTYQIDQISKENRKQIFEMISSFNRVGDSLRAMVDEGGNIDQAAESLKEAMASIDAITGRINRGEGSIGRLVNDDQTVENLNESLDGINQSLGLFRRVELRFRYRGEFLTQTNELQNQFGIFLYPAPDKYIQFEFVDSPVGETSVIETTIESGGTSTSTRSIQTDTSLTINLMFAKRLRNVSARVGLLRSHGGAGLDYYMFKDKLIFSGEMFHLGRPNNNPILRLYATARLYNHLIVTAGVDDLLEDNTNTHMNPFVGIGLYFTDNDFKAILPVLRGGM